MSNKKSSLAKLFKDKSLFTQALTHKSWVNEHKGDRQSNERLEFLGDAILEYVVSKKLYDKFPSKEEGYLTALRANVVNTKNLARVARTLDIGKFFYLSKGEDEGGGRINPSLLADTLEAIIGALYLDQGIKTVGSFINEKILSDLSQKIAAPLKDSKSRLQEKVQAKGLPAPNYQVVSEKGPDHSKTYLVEVLVEGKSLGKGEGISKNEAEQKAAKKAMKISL